MTWPASEVSIDESLIRDLLGEQYPHLADQPCYQVGEGFDNALWRLGDDLVVRIPRREVAAELIAKELRWLPEIASHASLRTPLALLAGEPNARFAWPWLIAHWVEGVPGDTLTPNDRRGSAVALGTFMREIHVDAPSDAPGNPFRGVPLVNNAAAFATRLHGLDGVVDVRTADELWAKCASAPTWHASPQWLHGDLHPANTIFQECDLVGVVDFGDLCAGDPATDLAGALMSLPFDALDTFFDTYGVVNAATMWRVVGWALHFGAIMTWLGLSSCPTYLAVGRCALDNAVRLGELL
jgi:aminoglycoside phosphotransferase (APT) family kinase protein